LAKVYVLVITPGVPVDGPPINCKFQGSKCVIFLDVEDLDSSRRKTMHRERERERESSSKCHILGMIISLFRILCKDDKESPCHAET